ncbi:MAG: protein jag [SAR202 cluster bacterium]|nr:protein jag [SAR202 cluster bacterium]
MRREIQMKSVETTAKTVEEAIEIALKELNVERREAKIDVIDKGKSGIFGIGLGVPAKVRVQVIDKNDSYEMDASEVLNDLIQFMDVSVSVHLKDSDSQYSNRPSFEIDGEDSGLLIGRRGETLKALRFLASSIISSKNKKRTNIYLDVAGYQERRYDSLSHLAEKVANQVLKSGKAIHLEPMPANERRIIHLTLQDSVDVTTNSVGSGYDRRVVIEKNN